MPRSSTQNSLRLTAAALILTTGTLAAAQSTSPSPAKSPTAPPAAPTPSSVTSTTSTPAAARPTANPALVNLSKMQKRVTVELKDQRLEDAIRFIQETTQAEIEVEWITPNSTAGLDKDKSITVNIQNLPALDALERILSKGQEDAFTENGWQMTSYGTIQIGPKSLLNKDRRVVIYDINDLLLEIPRYTDVPQIDLQAVLGQGQGGSGQSPFAGGNNNGPGTDGGKTREERIRELQDLITSTIEPAQWVDNGGEGATIRAYGNTLIVNAPDYVHRGINGYDYWPSTTTKVVNGRRYLSLTMDTGISTVDGFATQPVTGVAGGGTTGGGGGTGTGGGGGGGTTPPPRGPR